MRCVGAHVLSGREAVTALGTAIHSLLDKTTTPQMAYTVPLEFAEATMENFAWYLDEQRLHARFNAWAALATSEDVKNALHREANTTTDELESVGLVMAGRFVNRIGREFCGADFLEIMRGQPFDGEPHDYECPHCGNRGSYVAPYYPAPLINEDAAIELAAAVEGEAVSPVVFLAVSAKRGTSAWDEIARFVQLWQRPVVEVSEVIRIAALLQADGAGPVVWGSRGVILAARPAVNASSAD
jgi:hypothetical protein